MRLRAGSYEGKVVVSEVAFLTQIGLRADRPLTRTACAGAIGLELPGPSTVVRRGSRAALGFGPDEWLIVDPPDRQAEILAALAAAVPDGHVSAVDLSANRTVLELAGPHARDVLAAGCKLDLHARAFGPGRCAATDVASVSVYLDHLDDDVYRLHVRPSFAAHLAEWLLDAMIEYVGPGLGLMPTEVVDIG